MNATPPVESLEDIRARSAQRFWATAPPASEAINAARSLPPLVLTHGLLATMASAKARGGAQRALMLEVCRFLCDPERAVLPPPSPKQEHDDDLDPYLRLLTDGTDATSLRLQRVTAEALAYLATLKRLAPQSTKP